MDVLKQLQAWMKREKLDAFIVPRSDKYQGEEVRGCDERLAYLTGFTGSAGIAVVTQRKAALFVDGRYTEQAPVQSEPMGFKVFGSATKSPGDWLAKQKGLETLGFDAWVITAQQAKSWQRQAESLELELVELDQNPLDEIWDNRPQPASVKVREHPIAWSGQNSFDKRQTVLKALPNQAALFVGSPENVSWLLNARSDALATTPSVLGYAILQPDLSVDWIVEPSAYASAKALQLENVRVYRSLERPLRDLDVPLAYDPASTPRAVERLLARRATQSVASPIPLLQAIKNKAELDGMRQAHLVDGAVMARFLASIAAELPGFLDEVQAAEQLDSMRLHAGAGSLAFPTISAAGPNAALPHYRATKDSKRPAKTGDIYLVDSGGQYACGTTDVTRTTVMGTANDEQKRLYTLVLQGHLDLLNARFTDGTSGQALDAIARMPLWQAGLDFDHGTGHGVGAVLGVHEGPQRIAKPTGAMPVGLRPGMVVSIEPGYYRAGDLGIRIENLAIVVKDKRKSDERSMLAFENLTWVPYERALIQTKLLTNLQIKQIDTYHKRVQKMVSPQLTGSALAWLQEACKSLS